MSDAQKKCPHCQGNLDNMNDGYFCLKCNASFSTASLQTKVEKHQEIRNYWLWILGFLVLAAMTGPVAPVGIAVVLLGALVFQVVAYWKAK